VRRAFSRDAIHKTDVDPGGSIGGKGRFSSPSIGIPRGRRHALCVDGQSHSRKTAMPDEPILEDRDKARTAIESGRLPTAKPSRMLCGPSVGETCAVCGDLIPVGAMQFELEFQPGPSPEAKLLKDALERLRASPKVSRYHLHHRCFTAWELERTKVTRSADDRSSI